MGKNLIQQRRGRGTLTFRTPGHRFQGPAKQINKSGKVVDVFHCPGHTAPLMSVLSIDGEKQLSIAPEGIKVNDQLSAEGIAEPNPGNVLYLKDIPEGTSVYNIESRPGDGGKFVRSSGAFAKIIAKTAKAITVKLPSSKEKVFDPNCRAAIGVVAGAGRPEKPFLKAGTRFHRMRARNKLYPVVSGTSMNAVDHPFGGSCSTHKGRPTIAPKNAPPGRNVGKLRARRTGKQK